MYPTVTLVAVAALLCVCTAAPAPVPELIISQPLFYPHGRSNQINQPKQDQHQQQQHVPAQSSYVPQVVKPPSNMQMQMGTGSGSTRTNNYEGWGDGHPLVKQRSKDNRGNYPTLSSLTGYIKQRTQQTPKLLIAKPLFDPSQKPVGNRNPASGNQDQAQAQESQASASSSSSSATANQVQVEASEQGAIEIPEIGGIEYYDLVNHIRSWADTVKDAAVKTPGNVASVIQTAWRGSSNILAQVRDNMPDIQLPSLTDMTQGEDSYVAASQLAPLAPFPYFSGSFFSSKKRPPLESYWLDNYGV